MSYSVGGYSIACDVMLTIKGASRGGVGSAWLRDRLSVRSVGRRIGKLFFVITHCEYLLSALLLIVSLSLAVPVNCPYPNPRGFAVVFPFPSPGRRGRGE